MRDVRRAGGGSGLCGGPGKRVDGCFLDDLRAFGINADQWTTAAQDKGEWRRTAERGAEHFMARWIAADKSKAGLLAVVCLNVTGRTKRIAQSKRTRPCCLATSGANLYPPDVWFADVMTSLSGVTFVCFASFSLICFH